jgi:hypothetical protein
MLQTKRTFLNSKPTIEMISKKFRCPISVIRQSMIEETAAEKGIRSLQNIL